MATTYTDARQSGPLVKTYRQELDAEDMPCMVSDGNEDAWVRKVDYDKLLRVTDYWVDQAHGAESIYLTAAERLQVIQEKLNEIT